LRNLTKKRQPVPEQHVLEQVLVEQLESQTVNEQIIELDFMITSYHSDDEDEQANSWFKPGFLKRSASSSSILVLNSVPDLPSEINFVIVEPNLPSTIDLPSSSSQAIQTCAPARSTNVPSPPTMFLDSTILADVCENIFHEESYEKQWMRLRERVDFVLTELQRSSFDAQDIAQNNLQDWLKGVVNNLQEVRVRRTQEKTQLCVKGKNASDVIPSYVHPNELDLTWLNKINFKQASTELELVQRNSELERENKQL